MKRRYQKAQSLKRTPGQQPETPVRPLGEIHDVSGRIERRLLVVLAELLRDRTTDRHPVGKCIVEPKMHQTGQQVSQKAAHQESDYCEPRAGSRMLRDEYIATICVRTPMTIMGFEAWGSSTILITPGAVF